LSLPKEELHARKKPCSSYIARALIELSIPVRDRLDLDSVVESLLLLVLLGDSLGTHDTTTPVALGLLVLVHVTLLDGLDELAELGLVL
jgi:hypothetical protein